MKVKTKQGQLIIMIREEDWLIGNWFKNLFTYLDDQQKPIWKRVKKSLYKSLLIYI